MKIVNSANPMTVEELRRYADECGAESAYNMVLLLGPDWIEGGWDTYETLLAEYET